MKIKVEEKLIENLLDIINQQQKKNTYLEDELSDVKKLLEGWNNTYKLLYLFMLKSPESYNKLKHLANKDERLKELVYLLNPENCNELNEYGKLYSA